MDFTIPGHYGANMGLPSLGTNSGSHSPARECTDIKSLALPAVYGNFVNSPSTLVDGIKGPQECLEAGGTGSGFWQATSQLVGEWLEINLGFMERLFEVEVVFQKDCKQEPGYMAGVEVRAFEILTCCSQRLMSRWKCQFSYNH